VTPGALALSASLIVLWLVWRPIVARLLRRGTFTPTTATAALIARAPTVFIAAAVLTGGSLLVIAFVAAGALVGNVLLFRYRRDVLEDLPRSTG
jgi:hypothetical protein